MSKDEDTNHHSDAEIGARLADVIGTIARLRSATAGEEELGADVVSALMQDAIDELRSISVELRQLERRQLRLEVGKTTTTTIGALIARSVKAMRNQCERTQTQLAADMARLGFVTWKRITVAETESGKRRPTWEELIGLCALFGISLESLMGALTEREVIFLNERRVVTAAEYAELIGLPAELIDMSPAERISVDVARFHGAAFGLAGDPIPKDKADLYAWSTAMELAARAGAIIADIDQPFSDEDWRPIAELRRRVRQSGLASQPAEDESL